MEILAIEIETTILSILTTNIDNDFIDVNADSKLELDNNESGDDGHSHDASRQDVNLREDSMIQQVEDLSILGPFDNTPQLILVSISYYNSI